MRNALRLVMGLMVVGIMAVGVAGADDKTMMATGKVTAVTGESLTIQKGADTMTFTVDNTTKIVGKGLTTKTNEKAAKGEKMTLSDSVGKDDMVTVSYHEMGGKMHASQVKINTKAFTTPK